MGILEIYTTFIQVMRNLLMCVTPLALNVKRGRLSFGVAVAEKPHSSEGLKVGVCR